MNARAIIDYLKSERLVLATAESCTGGEIAASIIKQGNCGDCVFLGYTLYSEVAKQKCLGVKPSTIEAHTLTSEAVAREMVKGLSEHEEVNVMIATTGITGPDPLDGIPPGTVCFAWGFKIKGQLILFSETQQFTGVSTLIIKKAVQHALKQLPVLHKKSIEGI
ncbi:MAG: nicotinamide-nucleotide amidohydrolase family protein [Legionella sp.]|nr:nicotinamide-nucleotide amidohydrolase family protein [Legionella sp.]